MKRESQGIKLWSLGLRWVQGFGFTGKAFKGKLPCHAVTEDLTVAWN